MKLHILGICGTFMSGLALLAKEAGHEVIGSDTNIYPPMSQQLQESAIELRNGYDARHIDADTDCVIVGNVIKRGNPAIEYVLNQRIPYTSGPLWLYENVLNKRVVIAVAGTHGKTTTTSLIAWILASFGLNPGFLIGGIPENFGVSAKLGVSPFFVIEADEYDSAFFDKRAKFIHYRPQILVLNNLEYDHADIYPDLNAIIQQFIYLLRTVPGNGLVIQNQADENLHELLAPHKGHCFTKIASFNGQNATWHAKAYAKDYSEFEIFQHEKAYGHAKWSLLGEHNMNNALAALAAAHEVGVPHEVAIQALSTFKNVKRRLEVKACVNDIVIYDDFAHHPTAIATTLAGLRAKIGEKARLIAILEFGSYTMRAGIHKARIKDALAFADEVICKETENNWGLKEILKEFPQSAVSFTHVEHIVDHLVPKLRPGDHVIIMSNSGFEGIHQKLLAAIERG